MWDFEGGQPGNNRFLVLGFSEPAADSFEPPQRGDLIACGPLLSDDGTAVLGAAVLLEASHVETAQEVLSPEHYAGIEVHQWRSGGRP